MLRRIVFSPIRISLERKEKIRPQPDWENALAGENGGEGARHDARFIICNPLHMALLPFVPMPITPHPAYATLCNPMYPVTFVMWGSMLDKCDAESCRGTKRA